MSNRIALVAKRKSGKSTVAEMLVRSHGFTRMALAGPLKDSAVEMLNAWLAGQGVSRNAVRGRVIIRQSDKPITRDELEANKATFRPLLEWLGTTFGREYLRTPERWIEQFSEALPSDTRVVVDDMRQPNEADALRAMGFVIVRIERPETERLAELARCGEPMGVMASERFIDQIEADAVIDNTGDLSHLEAQVCAMAHWARDEAA